jgi:hypothetical protein
MIAEPELGMWSLGSERLNDGFVRDHPGSLDCRIRNDAADCADANACDVYCYGCSDGELGDARTHFDAPSIGRAGVVTQGNNYSAFGANLVTYLTGAQSFCFARIRLVQACP